MNVICAALAAAAIGVTAASAAPAAAPTPLAGTWTKTITAATWHRNHIHYEAPGRWAIVVKGSVTSIYTPPGKTDDYALTTMHTAGSTGSVVFGPTADGFCPARATYRWKVTGSMLRFTLVKDGCNARLVLLTAGTWRRT